MPIRDADGNGDGERRAARVRRTGIALVHEGELILPAAGSEAQAERVLEDQQAVIQYLFPVEIEVRAAPDPIDPETIIQETLRRLAQGMENV